MRVEEKSVCSCGGGGGGGGLEGNEGITGLGKGAVMTSFFSRKGLLLEGWGLLSVLENIRLPS